MLQLKTKYKYESFFEKGLICLVAYKIFFDLLSNSYQQPIMHVIYYLNAASFQQQRQCGYYFNIFRKKNTIFFSKFNLNKINDSYSVQNQNKK